MVAMPFLLGVIFLHYFKLTYTLFDSYYSQIAQISIDLAKECLAERYEKYSDKSWKCVFFNRFPRIITSFSVFHVKIEWGESVNCLEVNRYFLDEKTTIRNKCSNFLREMVNSYLSLPDRNLSLLFDYADKLRVRRILEQYIALKLWVKSRTME